MPWIGKKKFRVERLSIIHSFILQAFIGQFGSNPSWVQIYKKSYSKLEKKTNTEDDIHHHTVDMDRFQGIVRTQSTSAMTERD